MDISIPEFLVLSLQNLLPRYHLILNLLEGKTQDLVMVLFILTELYHFFIKFYVKIRPTSNVPGRIIYRVEAANQCK